MVCTYWEIVISNYYQLKSLADDLIGTGYCKHESRLVLRSAEILPTFYDLIINPPCYLISAGVAIRLNYAHYTNYIYFIQILKYHFGVLGFWG